ncbi:aldehyde dehydrogenase [Trametes coccinea BRFM310]|uniref:Aldehyde dehydrogenase n=1 Tax=Trametes coccinea (strain BRFM310) TaxID=1353009 RepID=A0A1Y2IUT1_TRAC3|nr:aldehyde dehydrogenase [Trametes coccinea BRFM310]
MSLPFTPLFINGEWRPASGGESFEVRNPTTGKLVGTTASASTEDCAAAIEAAALAFQTWENSPLSLRRDILLKASDILASDEYKEKIMRAVNEETSATADTVVFNHMGPVNELRNFAGATTRLKGESFVSWIPGGQVFAQRKALGVVLSIAPWNAPIGLSLKSIVLPLVCGNTVVFKCSEVSPRTQSIVMEILDKAGLPKGVVNFIAASREDSPARVAQIIAHPAIRKINFTGSDTVGRLIAAEAAKYLKPCVFELGGKAPVVVLEDADISRAARAITSSALLHSGQICMSTERVIIQKGATEALIEQLKLLFKQIRAGDPQSDPSVTIGALFTQNSAENVINMIKEAVRDGAQVLIGDLKRDGAIVQPHIVAGVKPGMRLWDRESFGPVIALAVVDTIDDAVAAANASDYSLVAGLWTKDVHTAFDVASRIRAGCTNINGPTVHVEWMRSHGGLGGSTGYGRFMIDDWTDLRMMVLHPAKEPPYAITAKLNGVA